MFSQVLFSPQWDMRTSASHQLHAQACSGDWCYILHSLLRLFSSFLWGMSQETIFSSGLLIAAMTNLQPPAFPLPLNCCCYTSHLWLARQGQDLCLHPQIRILWNKKIVGWLSGSWGNSTRFYLPPLSLVSYTCCFWLTSSTCTHLSSKIPLQPRSPLNPVSRFSTPTLV